MTPSSAPRSTPSSDTATILFFGNVSSWLGSDPVQTIWDEQGRFVGELVGVSAFEIRVPPGRHAFCGGWLAGLSDEQATKSCVLGWIPSAGCFIGDFAAGKYYMAWLRYSNEAPSGAVQYAMRWLFPHPDSKTLTAQEALRRAAELGGVPQVPMYVPDPVRGQALLNKYAFCKPSTSEGDVNPESWGYDAPP